jgi:hypothetical protein
MDVLGHGLPGTGLADLTGRGQHPRHVSRTAALPWCRSAPDRPALHQIAVSAPRPAALRPGRLRDLRHGHRDERHPARPIRAAQGEAAARNIRDLRFTRQDYYLPPEFAAPRRFYATTGISVTRDGVNHSEDVTLAARNALLNMIDHLGNVAGHGSRPTPSAAWQ